MYTQEGVYLIPARKSIKITDMITV